MNTKASFGGGVGDLPNTWGFESKAGQKIYEGRASKYGSSSSSSSSTGLWEQGDVIGCLWDGDNRTISFRRNGFNLEVAFTGVNLLKDMGENINESST
mmetsp:Transcript_21166/g.29677  ORF Transcript_21166/g.29677 Transcript_21166/m.29677 type:complete len:98 (+) Transcript_21166:297-590(+)